MLNIWSIYCQCGFNNVLLGKNRGAGLVYHMNQWYYDAIWCCPNGHGEKMAMLTYSPGNHRWTNDMQVSRTIRVWHLTTWHLFGFPFTSVMSWCQIQKVIMFKTHPSYYIYVYIYIYWFSYWLHVWQNIGVKYQLSYLANNVFWQQWTDSIGICLNVIVSQSSQALGAQDLCRGTTNSPGGDSCRNAFNAAVGPAVPQILSLTTNGHGKSPGNS